jgi:hypothetical protein
LIEKSYTLLLAAMHCSADIQAEVLQVSLVLQGKFNRTRHGVSVEAHMTKTLMFANGNVLQYLKCSHLRSIENTYVLYSRGLPKST